MHASRNPHRIGAMPADARPNLNYFCRMLLICLQIKLTTHQLKYAARNKLFYIHQQYNGFKLVDNTYTTTYYILKCFYTGQQNCVTAFYTSSDALA